MKFYKIEAAFDKKQFSNEKSRNIKSKSLDYNDREAIRQIIEDFNEKYKNRIYIFLVKFCSKKVILVAFSKDKADIISLTCKYLKKFKITSTKVVYKEITVKENNDLLEKSDYVYNSRDIIEEIWGNSLRYSFDNYFSESIFENEDNENILKKSKELFGADNLLSELNRIIVSKVYNHHFGHPVHYFIKTNEIDYSNKLIDLLLNALYNQKRINSKRISYYDITSFWRQHGTRLSCASGGWPGR